MNLATTAPAVGGFVGPTGGLVTGGEVGPTAVVVGSGVKDGDSDGRMMKVGDGLGVAVGCTKGGRVGEPEATAMWVGSAVPGGFDR